MTRSTCPNSIARANVPRFVFNVIGTRRLSGLSVTARPMIVRLTVTFVFPPDDNPLRNGPVNECANAFRPTALCVKPYSSAYELAAVSASGSSVTCDRTKSGMVVSFEPGLKRRMNIIWPFESSSTATMSYHRIGSPTRRERATTESQRRSHGRLRTPPTAVGDTDDPSDEQNRPSQHAATLFK
jgi:hypothetical protein